MRMEKDHRSEYCFAQKRILWYKAPDPGFGNVIMEEYLAAENYYIRYLKTKKNSDLNKLILCFFNSGKFSWRFVDKHSWILSFTRIGNRLQILSEYSLIRTRLRESYPFAFQWIMDSAEHNSKKSLIQAFDWMFIKLPDYRNKYLIKLLKGVDNQAKEYYLKMENPPIFNWMLQSPEKVKFPDVKIFGPDEVMFPDGTFLDPQDN